LEQDLISQFTHDQIVKLWTLLYQEYPSVTKYRKITLVLNKLRLRALKKEFPLTYSKKQIQLPMQIQNSLKYLERNYANSKNIKKSATTSITNPPDVIFFLKI